MMLHQTARIVTFSLLLSLVKPSLAENFNAAIAHSHWKGSSSPLECTLSHTIPGFGHATFSQASGEKQHFVLQSILGRLEPGKADLVAYPPNWKLNNRPRFLGKIRIAGGQSPIKLKDPLVYQMLQSLELGQKATFIVSPSNTKLQNKDRITLSEVGFQKPYQEYMKCIAQMIPQPFSQLKDSVLHFESGSTILSDEAEDRLEELARFIKADGKIRKIKLAGYSDSKGSYQANVQLSYERMWAIKDFLVMHNGIDADIFSLKDFADKGAIAPNRTAQGRAKNRRVVITLYR
jgi:outer membrane protein OmpA-like peptidoglycan-associated protein